MTLANLLAPALLGWSLMVAGGPTQAAFQLENSAGGNGSVSASGPTFTLTGADQPGESHPANWTTYLETISTSGFAHFLWHYSTQDDEASYDPAGWLLNGTAYQLTENALSIDQQGEVLVLLTAGDVFGWYVRSTDQSYGPAALTVTVDMPSEVPEPASALLMLAGAAALVTRRSRRRLARR